MNYQRRRKETETDTISGGESGIQRRRKGWACREIMALIDGGLDGRLFGTCACTVGDSGRYRSGMGNGQIDIEDMHGRS